MYESILTYILLFYKEKYKKLFSSALLFEKKHKKFFNHETRRFHFPNYKKFFQSRFCSTFWARKVTSWNIRLESFISRNIRKLHDARVLNVPFLKYKKFPLCQSPKYTFKLSRVFRFLKHKKLLNISAKKFGFPKYKKI